MPTIKITQPVAVAGIHYAVGDIVTVTQQDSKLLLAFGDAIEVEEPATQAPADAPTQAPKATPVDGGVQADAPVDAPTQATDAPPSIGGVQAEIVEPAVDAPPTDALTQATDAPPTDKPEEPPKDKAKTPKN